MAQYEVTLRDYWRILRRRKGIVLFTVFLLGLFSFVIANLWKPEPVYKATAKVQINSPQTIASLNMQYLGYGAGGGTDQLETQRSIITSFPVIRRTAERMGWFEDVASTEDSTRVILWLQGKLSTFQEGYTNIIGIEAEGSTAELAQKLANAVAEAYAEYDNAQKNEQSRKHLLFVEEQRDKARLALSVAEDSVKTYREQAELVSIDAQASVMLSQITAAQQSVNQLQQDVQAIDAMLKEMAEQKGLSERTMQGVSRARVGEVFMSLSQQLSALQLEREGLLAQYTEEHPKVQQLQAKIDELNRNLKDELRQRRQVVARDLAAVHGLLAQSKADYEQLPAKGLDLARLQREVALRQQVVGTLEEEYQSAKIRAADQVEEVTVLQKAVTPTQPTNPHDPLQRALMGVILGLVLGIVFAVVAESLDTSIGTVEDVQEYTGSQVVGIIPYIDLDDVRAALRRRGLDVADERTVQRKAQLVAYFDPQSTMAEAYRTLRTNIEFVTVEKGVKCLMVTSSMLREGKSTTVANLAMTMAQLGKRTLLVDCDLRKPTLARLFGLDKEPGMTEVIVGTHTWGQVVRTVTDIVTGGMGMEDILQTQGISNLHIITSGAIPPNPAELLNSKRMEEVIAEVREAYDVVLFDSPPTLQVTDAAILGKKVDGALMVYRVGDISRNSLKRSTSLLKSVQIELVGVVLNGLRADVSVEYQDLGYQSYYAYGSEASVRQRTFAERLQDYLRKWKKRLGKEEVSAESQEKERGRQRRMEHARDEEEEDGDHRDRPPRQGKGRAVASHLSLVLVGLGLTWQSGYLARPLGFIPVLAAYPPRPAEEGLAPAPEPVAEPGQAPSPEAPPDSGGQETLPPAPPAETSAAPQARTPPAQSATAPSREKVAVRPRPYAIHVASYPPDSQWEARTLKRFRESAQEAFLSPVVVKSQPFRRLLVGSFSSWDTAHRYAQQLQQQGLLEKFAILRLPYAVEIGSFAEIDQAYEALKGMGEGGNAAYVQVLKGGECRLLAGAFENAEEARRFAEAAVGGGGERVVSR